MAEEEARPGSSQSGGASEPTSREDAVGGELAPHSDSGDSGSLFGDMDDLFDAVDEVEDSATAQAFEEGRLKGREEGIVEGRELGYGGMVCVGTCVCEDDVATATSSAEWQKAQK